MRSMPSGVVGPREWRALDWMAASFCGESGSFLSSDMGTSFHVEAALELAEKCCGALQKGRGFDPALEFYIWIPSGSAVDDGPLRGERVRRSRGEGLLSSCRIIESLTHPSADGSPLSRKRARAVVN